MARKRGRKRVERRWGLYCHSDGMLVSEHGSDVVLLMYKGDTQNLVDHAGERDNPACEQCVPVRVTLTWEEPPRKEKQP